MRLHWKKTVGSKIGTFGQQLLGVWRLKIKRTRWNIVQYLVDPVITTLSLFVMCKFRRPNQG